MMFKPLHYTHKIPSDPYTIIVYLCRKTYSVGTVDLILHNIYTPANGKYQVVSDMENRLLNIRARTIGIVPLTWKSGFK